MYTRPRTPELETHERRLRVTSRALGLSAALCVAVFSASACSSDPETPDAGAGAGATARGGSSSGNGGSSKGGAGNSSAAGGGAGASGAGGSSVGGSGGAGGAAGGVGGGGGTGNVPVAGAGSGALGGSAGTSSTGGSGGEIGGMGGSSGGTSGAAGAAGTAGTGGTGVPWQCPAGPLFDEPATAGAVTKVMGVPPTGFGTGSSSNVEGPVWIDGSLYVSHIQEGVTNPPPARILKITGDTVEEFLRDSGSNGLALAADGRIVAARHTTGSISLLDLGTKMFAPLAEQYMSARFDSPNDVTVRSDGNVYFSDPDYQAPSTKPQSATRAYRVDPEGVVSVIDDSLSQPNGISLSRDQDALYIASQSGIRRYPVSPDGSVGTGAPFHSSSSDGMVVDCGGNVYLTTNRDVLILDPMGEEITRLMNVVPDGSSTTNLAFGGADHRRLFITARANAGLWYVDMNVPGMPY